MTGPVPSTSDVDRFSSELRGGRDHAGPGLDGTPPAVPDDGQAASMAELEQSTFAALESRARHHALTEKHQVLSDPQHHLEVERDPVLGELEDLLQ